MIPTRDIPAQIRLLRGHRRTREIVTGPAPTQPPVADANGPYTAEAGAAISFSSAGSYSPNGTWTKRWIFGDGSETAELASGAAVSHAYAAVGVYTAQLIVSDAYGSASDTAQVTVTAPTAVVASVEVTPDPVSGTAGGGVQLTARAYTAGGVLIPGKSGTWSSTNPSVALVPTGAPAAAVTCTFVAAGTATIRCTIDTIQSNAVEVTVNPLPTGLWPHEPTGAVRKAEHDYHDLPPYLTLGPSGVYGEWARRAAQSNATLVSDDPFSPSPGTCMQIRFPVDMVTGAEAQAHWCTLAGKPADGWSKIYLGQWIRVVGPTYEEIGAYGSKWFMFGSGKDNTAQQNIVYLKVGTGGTINSSPVQIRWAQQNLRYDISPTTGTANYFSPTYSKTLSLDGWHFIEVRVTCNDLGQANGIFEVWGDDAPIWNKRDCIFRLDMDEPGTGASLRNKLQSVILTSIPSSGSYKKTRPDYWRYGHTYFSAVA